MEAGTTSKSAVAEAKPVSTTRSPSSGCQYVLSLLKGTLFSPVCRLPPDVLATIFLYQAYSFYRDPRYSGTWGAPPWANVSYICRHWRDVALNTSSLWSFLFVSPARWTEELLSRTKMLPVRIRINVGHWDREEMIFLEQVTTDVTRIPGSFLGAPSQPRGRGLFQTVDTCAALAHVASFLERHPVLQVLELYHCHVPWSSPIFTALTSLRLRDIASSSQPTITELLAMLRHMPDLAHLYLENALPGAEDTLNNQHSLLSECLDLPHLSRLALVAPFSTVVVFLSNVIVPLKTEIRLCCRQFNTASDVGPVIRTLNIKTTSRDNVVSMIFMKTGFVVFTLKLDIELNLRKDREELVGDICRIIPMGIPLSSLFLETTFGNLQELRFIKLIQLQVNDWITALSRGSCKAEYGVSNAEDIFAPGLAELRCVVSVHGHSPVVKAKGYALKKLVIAGSSYVSDAQVEELREVVDEVDWDGYTQASGDTSDSDEDDQF
ncbi:hypothetical protein BU15DRAFT_81183 [Melanogaster broomeanus]|nr:hypothetical protein BU15DRAFT_81183 [Melanogaster broomeanus]